jgi:hypothetical protein
MRSLFLLLVAGGLAGAAAAASVAACTAFGSDSSQTEPVPTTDAGSSADEGGATDAAQRFDAAAPLFSCTEEATAAFCDDFEAPSAPPAFGWSEHFVNGGGVPVVAVEDGAGARGTRGLHVKMSGPAGAQYWLRRGLGAPASSATGSFDLELDFLVTAWESDHACIAGLWFFPPSATVVAGVALSDSAGPTVMASLPDVSTKYSGSVLNTWHHFAMEVAPAGGGMHDVRYRVDGQLVSQTQINLQGSEYPDVRVGVYYTNGTLFDGVFDNVVVRRRP